MSGIMSLFGRKEAPFEMLPSVDYPDNVTCLIAGDGQPMEDPVAVVHCTNMHLSPAQRQELSTSFFSRYVRPLFKKLPQRSEPAHSSVPVTHVFERRHILEWINQQNTTCPICRSAIKTDTFISVKEQVRKDIEGFYESHPQMRPCPDISSIHVEDFEVFLATQELSADYLERKSMQEEGREVRIYSGTGIDELVRKGRIGSSENLDLSLRYRVVIKVVDASTGLCEGRIEAIKSSLLGRLFHRH